MLTDDIPFNYGWGAWAHNNNFNVGTWSSDGTMHRGTAAINCSNYRGVFSFHPAGALRAFADGSVRLLAREMSPAVFFALVTARAGDITPEDIQHVYAMNRRSQVHLADAGGRTGTWPCRVPAKRSQTGVSRDRRGFLPRETGGRSPGHVCPLGRQRPEDAGGPAPRCRRTAPFA